MAEGSEAEHDRSPALSAALLAQVGAMNIFFLWKSADGAVEVPRPWHAGSSGRAPPRSRGSRAALPHEGR